MIFINLKNSEMKENNHNKHKLLGLRWFVNNFVTIIFESP